MRLAALVGLLLLVTGGAQAGEPVAVASRGWLGVELDSSGAGARIVRVLAGSPAERVGLKTGDQVVRADGIEVRGPRELARIVGAHSAGETALLVVRVGNVERVVPVALDRRPEATDSPTARIGLPAPPVSALVAATGEVTDLRRLLGRVVVVDFWATWCLPCRLMTPRLSSWQARYGAQGLTVVGISQESVEQLALYAHSSKVAYSLSSDPTGRAGSAFGVRSLPTLFVIDKRGVVRELIAGFDPSADAALEQKLAALLAEPFEGH